MILTHIEIDLQKKSGCENAYDLIIECANKVHMEIWTSQYDLEVEYNYHA